MRVALGVVFSMILATFPGCGGSDMPPAQQTEGGSVSTGYFVLWGDVHGHSAVTGHFCPDGMNDPRCPGLKGPEYYFQTALDNGLDFAVITDHAEDLTPAEWEQTKTAARLHDVPGVFVPFIGYEGAYASGATPNYVNAWLVIFPDLNGGPVYAHESFKGRGRECPEDRMVSREAIWEGLRGSGAMGIFAHPPSNGIDWNFGPAERAAMINVEVSSTGGRTAEDRYNWDGVLQGLGTGHKLGFSGSGNNHFALAGADALTAVLATSLTREAIVDALKNRRMYAVNHERIKLWFELSDGDNVYLMGAEARVPVRGDGSTAVITVSARATADKTPIRKVAVFRVQNGIEREIVSSEGSETIGSDELQPATGVSYYYARVYLRDTEAPMAWSSPIWVNVVP